MSSFASSPIAFIGAAVVAVVAVVTAYKAKFVRSGESSIAAAKGAVLDALRGGDGRLARRASNTAAFINFSITTRRNSKRTKTRTWDDDDDDGCSITIYILIIPIFNLLIIRVY